MSVSTILGVPVSNIAKVNGIPIANIAKWRGETIDSGSPFITEWVIPPDSLSATLPLRNTGRTVNCIVDWGDGNSSTVIAYNDPNRIHTYASAGTYQIKIYGACEGWSFSNGGDKLKVTKVINWGGGAQFAGFYSLLQGFYGCTNLIDIGTSKIKPCSAGLDNIQSCFDRCNLTNVPNGLLDLCTMVTNVYGMFSYNGNLTTIPKGLFRALTGLINANSTFYMCNSLKMEPEVFYNSGEQSTRFLNKSVDFTAFFAISDFIGVQGTAPDLWNCNFGTGTQTKTLAFGGTGNDATSLSNFASIPSDWK